MGLDMNLYAERYRGFQYDEDQEKHDTAFMGMKLQECKYEVAYWRKHNQLHGYLVKNFAHKEEDNCEPIWLTKENIEEIIEYLGSVQDIPATPGFFFGDDSNDYHPDQRKEDVDAFNKALNFLEAQEDDSNKRDVKNHNDDSVRINEYQHSVHYQASW